MFLLADYNVNPQLVFYKDITKKKKNAIIFLKNVFFITKYVIFNENFVYYSP